MVGQNIVVVNFIDITRIGMFEDKQVSCQGDWREGGLRGEERERERDGNESKKKNNAAKSQSITTTLHAV